MGRRHFSDADFGDWGDAGRESVAGPLIGGGITQVVSLATKIMGKGKPISKYSGLVGLLVGGGVGAALAFRPNTRGLGISALVTAALVGIPRQIEESMGIGSLNGMLGVITPEQSMAMAGWGDDQPGPMMGPGDVQLLDSGSGSAGLGVYAAEEGGGGMSGPPDIELMGSAGFGANFANVG